MKPAEFPEANTIFGPPDGMAVDQVHPIHSWLGSVNGGSLDGMSLVITAWRPTPEEIEQLKNGGLVYIAMIGGLMPHNLNTDFETARRSG